MFLDSLLPVPQAQDNYWELRVPVLHVGGYSDCCNTSVRFAHSINMAWAVETDSVRNRAVIHL